MKEKLWRRLIDSLPKGMTQADAAKYLSRKHGTVRFWMLRFGYKFEDGRTRCWPEARRKQRRTVDHDNFDWSKPNADLARQHGLSRERVRQIRAELKLSKVGGRKP